MTRTRSLLKTHPREFSGGQQQLVSLARALVSGAPLLLLDEPLSHLEPARRFRVRTAVRDFTTREKLSASIQHIHLFNAEDMRVEQVQRGMEPRTV